MALLTVIHMSGLEALVFMGCACFPEDIARVKMNYKLVLTIGHFAPLVFRDPGKWRNTFLVGIIDPDHLKEVELLLLN